MPFPSDGQELFVSASIGLSLYPDDAGTVDEIIKHADAAMYSAKHLGRNNFQFFTADLNQEVQERMLIEGGLRNAIQRDELSLLYQPKIDLATRQIYGAEALLRWVHPKLGKISPARFVPVAEEAGLVGQIGEWVLRTACRQIREWQDAGFALQVAVNVSARQFQQYDVAELVMGIMKDTGARPENLELELTESAVMNNAEASIITLERLAALGVQIAIDDFGTGYSSLSVLKHLPIDRLKIDQSFVRDLPADRDDMAIAEAICALSRTLDLQITAEGVETATQLDALRRLGCDEAQGFLFSRPRPADEIATLLEGARPWSALFPEGEHRE